MSYLVKARLNFAYVFQVDSRLQMVYEALLKLLLTTDSPRGAVKSHIPCVDLNCVIMGRKKQNKTKQSKPNTQNGIDEVTCKQNDQLEKFC